MKLGDTIYSDIENTVYTLKDINYLGYIFITNPYEHNQIEYIIPKSDIDYPSNTIKERTWIRRLIKKHRYYIDSIILLRLDTYLKFKIEEYEVLIKDYKEKLNKSI